MKDYLFLIIILGLAVFVVMNLSAHENLTAFVVSDECNNVAVPSGVPPVFDSVDCVVACQQLCEENNQEFFNTTYTTDRRMVCSACTCRCS